MFMHNLNENALDLGSMLFYSHNLQMYEQLEQDD